MFIKVGQVWLSPDTGNRWQVEGFTLGVDQGDGKVKVKRLPRHGQRRLPKWEGDGIYHFHPSQFGMMKLEESTETPT